MKTQRETLIETAVGNAQLPPELAGLLLDSAPWLDGTEGVNEELGPDLLAEDASQFKLSRSQIGDFLRCYNELVQASENPDALLQKEAYLAAVQVLAPYGREDAFGEGDYWLVSDSFSSSVPVVVVFGDFRFTAEALSKLQELLKQYGSVFSEFRVDADSGAELCTLRPV